MNPPVESEAGLTVKYSEAFECVPLRSVKAVCTSRVARGAFVPIPKKLFVSSQNRLALSCPRFPEPSTNNTDPAVPEVTALPIAIPDPEPEPQSEPVTPTTPELLTL